MPTVDSLIPVTFMQGIDTKTDPKAVKGNLLTVENGVFTKGQIIQKRYGTTSLGTTIINSGSSLSAGSSLSNFQDECLAFDGNRMYSYSLTNNSLLDRGTCVSVQVENNPIITTNSDILSTSSVVNQNIGVYTWWDGANIYASVFDKQVGTPIASSLLITGEYLPTGQFQLVAAGNSVFILFVSNGDLVSCQLSLVNPTYFGSFTTLQTNVAASGLFDAVPFRGGAIVAYANSNPSISVFYLTAQGQVNNFAIGATSATTIISDSPTNCLSVITDVNQNASITVAWFNSSTGIRRMTFDSSLNQTIGGIANIDLFTSPQAVNITGYTSGSSIFSFYELTSSISVNERVRSAVSLTSSTGNIVPGADFRRSVGLAGKAFVYNNKGYVPVIFNSPLQATYFLYSNDKQQVAKMQNQQAGSYGVAGFLSNMNYQMVDGVPTYSFANLYKAVVDSENGKLYANRGVTETSIAFSTNNEFSAATLGKNLHIVGGFLQNYDGKSVTEHSFNVYPEGASLSASIATVSGAIGSGSAQIAGTPSIWTYYFTYRYRDNQGEFHESTPSVGQNVTLTGSTNQVTWTIPTLRLTSKVSASIGVYRSTINTTDAVYLLSSLTGVLNDPTQDTVTFVDGYADSQIASNQILYTIGGVQSSDCPPAPAAVTTNKNRLWMISSENPLQLYFSQLFAPNQGVSFNLGNTIQVNPYGGACTVLSSLETTLIIFKENCIYYLSGDGPDGTGANSDYSDPILIPSDVGCINPASVVVTKLGIFFQSAKGIYLLDPGLTLRYIGAQVEKWNAYEITSAVVLPNTNQVRFTLANGPTLVFDTYFGQWSTFIGNYTNVLGSTLFNGNHTIITSAGSLYTENQGTYQDDFENVSMNIETGWLNLGQTLQGFQRVKRVHLLGNLGSQHNLFVQVSYNYNDAVMQTILFNAKNALNNSVWGSDSTWGSASLWGSQNQTYNGPSDTVYQWRDSLNIQKCEAIKFKFTDTYSGILGAGYSINELLLTIGQKKGPYKLPSNKTI